MYSGVQLLVNFNQYRIEHYLKLCLGKAEAISTIMKKIETVISSSTSFGFGNLVSVTINAANRTKMCSWCILISTEAYRQNIWKFIWNV